MRKQLVSLVLIAFAFSSVLAQAANKTNSSPPVVQSAPATSDNSQKSSGIVTTSAEDWKGNPETAEWSFGVLTGLGIVDATPGFAIMPAIAKKIVDRGFIPDITNSVWLETELGTVIAKGSAAFQFSGHLRWDFVRNEEWTFYALGGFGGASTGATLGDKFEFYPRFGAGALWKIFADFNIRGEVSHELVAVGVQIDL